MSNSKKSVKLKLKVMMNKERSKVLFAEVDSHFADILLSFLTLPLGRVLKILRLQYKNKAPKIGSLNNLKDSFLNLDFVEVANKADLLRGRSSFEAEYRKLKLDITESLHVKCLNCGTDSETYIYCQSCVVNSMKRNSKRLEDDGVFILKGTSFLISDDLKILPNGTGLFGIMSFLGITNMDEAEQTLVEIGWTEITNLLKASLTSSTPLSDVILNKTSSANILESQPIKSSPQVAHEQSPTTFRNLSLKVTIQRSTGMLLHAQAMEDFMQFLLGLLNIPLGRAEHLQGGKTSFKAINSLYRSAAELIDDKYFKKGMKTRLMKLKQPDSAESNTRPDTGEPLLSGSYQVMDDLTVVPFSVMSMISTLKEQKIAISDVEEVELQIGSKEALSILEASLSSTTVLTDALIKHMPNKRVKRET